MLRSQPDVHAEEGAPAARGRSRPGQRENSQRVARAHRLPSDSATAPCCGDFEKAFDAAEVKIDETYTVPDQAHAMMEPHATIARWDGARLTCWTSIQAMNWGTRDLALILGIPRENVRLISSFIGGGFGGKGTVQSDLVLAAVAARTVGRPVKIALQRPIMFNNTIHRPKTIQRIRLAASRDGRL